jgi:hypothetical protein
MLGALFVATIALAASRQAPAAGGVRLFGVREPIADPRFAAELKHVDPEVDGWPTEVIHDQAAPRLRELASWLWNGADAERVRALVAPDFSGSTELRPGDLALAHEARGTRVLRPRAVSGDRRGAESLAEIAAALRAPFGGAKVRCEVLIVALDLAADGASFSTEAIVRADADTASGPVQQVARWRVDWTRPAEPPRAPLVSAIALLDFEEASAPRPLFGEHTARVFGSLACYAGELSVSLSEQRFQSDQIAGDSFLGGNGLAVGDVDGDGLDDLYLCMQGGAPNRLFVHLPDGTVADRTQESKAGFLDPSRSALICDFDDDGRQDLAVAVGANVVVAYGDGKGVFEQQVVLASPSPEEVYSLTAADADRDGDLDLYACRYVSGGMIGGVPLPYHDAKNGAPNVYWRNEGRGRFTNATDEAGFGAANDRYSMAAIWEDFDQDGDLDLYVANDFGRNNLFRNEGGRFRDVALEVGADDMAAGMGATIADVELDGDLDLYVSNMFSAAGLRTARLSSRFMNGAHPELTPHYVRHARGNTLLLADEGGTFEDATERMRVAFGRWAWGAKFADFDGDGYEDLYVPNGFVTNPGPFDAESYFWRRVVGQSPPGEEPSEAYRRAWGSLQQVVLVGNASYNGHERNGAFLNLGGRGFADVAALTGADFEDDGRAVALADWDDDGKVDLVLANRTAPRVRLLRNQTPSGAHFLAVDLAGAARNRDAIGARVVVELEGRTLTKTLYAGDGYLSQSSKRLHFGLGDAQRVRKLTVRWPDGTKSELEDLAADTRYRVVQGEAAPSVVAPRTHAGFAGAAPRSIATSSGKVERVVLADRLPMAPFPLPRFGAAAQKVSDFAGRALLIAFWSSASPECVALVEALARERTALAAAGLEVLLLTIDEGPELFAARKRIEALGLGGGYADGRTLSLLEVLLIRVLKNADEIEVPAALLVDPNGSCAALYLGAVDLAQARADAALLAGEGGKGRSTAALTGGRWIARPRREFKLLGRVFEKVGASELASYYRALDERESARGK